MLMQHHTVAWKFRRLYDIGLIAATCHVLCWTDFTTVKLASADTLAVTKRSPYVEVVNASIWNVNMRTILYGRRNQ
jgi:hypothetical protein